MSMSMSMELALIHPVPMDNDDEECGGGGGGGGGGGEEETGSADLSQTDDINSLFQKLYLSLSEEEKSDIISGGDDSDSRFLCSSLCSLEMPDVALCVPEQGIKILCHGCMLSTNCEFFKTILSDNWSANQTQNATNSVATGVKMKEVMCDAEPRHIRYLLRYLYGDDIFNIQVMCKNKEDVSSNIKEVTAVTVQDAIGIYALAHFWASSIAILQACEDYIYNAVKADSSVHVLTFADTYSLPRLKDKCFSLAIYALTLSPANSTQLEGVGHSVSTNSKVGLSHDVYQCMKVLRQACMFVKSKHNFDVQSSVREVVALLKESLLEDEEVWRMSVLRHAEEMQTLAEAEAKATGGGININTEYRERLQRVQANLDKQEQTLRPRRAFLEQQEKSLSLLGL